MNIIKAFIEILILNILITFFIGVIILAVVSFIVVL